MRPYFNAAKIKALLVKVVAFSDIDCKYRITHPWTMSNIVAFKRISHIRDALDWTGCASG